MQLLYFIFYSMLITQQISDTPDQCIKASKEILMAAKTNKSVETQIQYFINLDPNTLQNELYNDEIKKTFWINIYNAYTQILLSNNPEKYKKRNAFFSSKEIIIAGSKMSLDDIEHGILRRSKNKWSLGYLQKIFPSSFEKKYRVDTLDNRIHFTLNCGAKSCPPIAFYKTETINTQLDIATKTFLTNEVNWNSDSATIYLPTFMNWFSADFGGKKGMRKLLIKYAIPTPSKKYSIRFNKYDWSLFLQQYTE